MGRGLWRKTCPPTWTRLRLKRRLRRHGSAASSWITLGQGWCPRSIAPARLEMGMKITLTNVEAAELHTLLECLEHCGLRSRTTVEEQSTMACLSAREVTILHLMAEGESNESITSRLC